MFRKKDTDTDLSTGDGAFRRPGDSSVKSTSQSELPRRKVDLPGGPGGTSTGSIEPSGSLSRGDAEPDKYGGKRLIVGEGIRLSGEISSCDRLVVEGEVEVTLNDTLALEIASSGRFTGGCEVEEADISGVYEGDLMVRRRLFVRGTGRLTGTIRYGELELERGGQIAGNVSVLSAEAAASASGSSHKAAASSSSSRSTPYGGTSESSSSSEAAVKSA